MTSWIREQAVVGASVLVACCLAAGCAQPGRTGGAAREDAGAERVDRLYLMAMPLALNLDQVPGGDGFQVKVYAVSRAHPKPLPIAEGTLEILMYDGVPENISECAPKKVWSYSAAQLTAHAKSSLVGTGYAFTLKWDQAVPSQRKITVAARYASPGGSNVLSAASSIAVAD